MYLIGATVWSSLIAVYRILFIKAQKWVQNQFGDKTFLRLIFISGLAQSFAFSYLLAFFDYEGVNIKLCTHLNSEGIDILQNLKVTISDFFSMQTFISMVYLNYIFIST
jgi:hypothetical protein